MDLFLRIIVCFIAGAGAGIGTGFAGMSAAGIIAPMLTVFLDVPAYEAIGIGLLSDVLASGVSAYTYKKSGNLDIRRSLPMLISVLLMTVVGSFVASFLPERAMGNTSQIAMLIIGLRFLLKPSRATASRTNTDSSRARLIKAIVGGVLVGFICGFVGAGGGMMMLFVLTSFLGYELHIAVGTSVFIMTFTALTGGVSHFVINGMPDLLCLALCVVFTLIWARIASLIANRSKAETLSRVVGIVMILTAATILIVRLIK